MVFVNDPMADPKKLPISSLIFLLPPSVEACSVASASSFPSGRLRLGGTMFKAAIPFVVRTTPSAESGPMRRTNPSSISQSSVLANTLSKGYADAITCRRSRPNASATRSGSMARAIGNVLKTSLKITAAISLNSCIWDGTSGAVIGLSNLTVRWRHRSATVECRTGPEQTGLHLTSMRNDLCC